LVAATAGRADLVEIFIRTDKQAISSKTTGEETLLHLAAWANEPKVAEVLLANKAPLEEKDDSGLTPLHFAAARDSKEVVAQLIKAGASIRATFGDAQPLHLATVNGHARVVVLLLDARASIEATV